MWTVIPSYLVYNANNSNEIITPPVKTVTAMGTTHPLTVPLLLTGVAGGAPLSVPVTILELTFTSVKIVSSKRVTPIASDDSVKVRLAGPSR